MAKEVILLINGQQVENTFNKLSATVRKFERELRKLTPGTEDFINKTAQVREARAHFQAVKNEIDAVRQSAEKSIGILGRMSNALGEIGVGILKSFAAGNIVSTFTSRISKTTDELLKLSDQMSAVVKTTGLAQKEVKGLWQEFDKFNTRTSKMDLLKISEMGGRLGISDAKELAAFTQEIDKAYVALGDSFSGGLEAVASQLGKIKGLFAETAELSYAEAINKIGSALNELGASGTASEQNMAEFALRIGRLPEALRPAVDVVLGLGAAFEESGVDARIASTGFSDFVSTAATNIDDFAYSMNITVEQAKELINANPEEFFLRFAEGMKGLNAVETAKVLESLKLGSQAVQGAVGAATQNVQLFRDKLILSNQALEEGISMNNEFNEVNNNAAAIWQKIKNVVDEFFTSGEIFNRFEGIIQLMGDFAGVTDDASGRGERLRQLIILLAKTVRTATVVWLAYVAGQKISIIWTTRSMAAIIGETAAKKLSVFWTNSLTAGTHLATAAKMLFTGKVLLARNAMIAFNNSVRLNPLGFLLSLLAAAAVAMGLFGKKAKDASDATDNLSNRQKALNEATKESADIAAKEISKLEQLYKAATNVALSMDQRKEAVKQLKSEYPDYFAQIKDEIIMNGLAENSYISLRNSIMDAARSRALSGKAEEFMSEVLEYENQINEIQKRIGKFVKMHNESTQLEIEIAFQDGTIIGMEDGYGQINELNAKIAETRENYDFFLNQAAKLGQKFIETNRNLGGSTPVGTTQNRASQKTDKIDTGQAAALAAEKEWEQKRLQAQREFWDASHQLDKEGMETEQKMAAEKNRRELEDLDRANAEHLAKQQEYAEQINRLNSLSPKTAKEKQEIADSIARYEAAMTRIDDVIATNQKRRAVLEETGRIELKTIEEKYIMLSLEDQKKAFDEEQKMKAVQFEIDVNNLEATEAEKERLRKEFQAQQLTEQSAFLDHLRAQIMQLLNTGDYDALDMENLVLSDEAKERLVEKLKELGFSIKDIQAALSGLSPNQQKEFSSAGFISGTDILGMSPDQWTELFANLDQWRGKLELMVGITQAMQQVWSMFHDANMQKEQEALRRFEATTQRRKDLLQQQLNEGYINQEQYNAKVQELEQVVAKKRAELEYKQAKKEKQNALISSIINTALGVSNALTVKPLVPLGMMLTGLVGSLGLAQTALIASQRLPSPTGYARGGFTQGLGWRDQSGHEVAGVVHADEYVIPKWLREDPVVADVVDWLEARRTGAKGYAQGGVVQAASSQITTTSVPPFEQKLDPVIIDLLGRFLHVVEDIEADGIRAYVVGDERQGKALKHSIDSYNNIRHKNRI